MIRVYDNAGTPLNGLGQAWGSDADVRAACELCPTNAMGGLGALGISCEDLNTRWTQDEYKKCKEAQKKVESVTGKSSTKNEESSEAAEYRRAYEASQRRPAPAPAPAPGKKQEIEPLFQYVGKKAVEQQAEIQKKAEEQKAGFFANIPTWQLAAGVGLLGLAAYFTFKK